MSVKMRQLVEKEIATAVIDALLAGGFAISIDNGDEDLAIKDSKDRAAILNTMFQTDDEYLIARDGVRRGWVRFIYGNDGWDVINDYSVNLEGWIGDGTPVHAVIDKYSD